MADEGDVDLAVEGGDDVGEVATGGGAQVDGAFEGLFEQRGFGFGEADVGSRRAAFAGNWPSANWTRVQGFWRWAFSRNSEWGRVTATRAMLA